MTSGLSKTQIDHLGDRLRHGNITQDDLRVLDDYRLSFEEAYEIVVRSMRERLGIEATGRRTKSTSSIVEKLRRESMRLTQMQDIAGCRVVVPGILEQDRVSASLRGLFSARLDKDRRTTTSHGYRAVHLIAEVSGKLVEIQVRTLLQDLWAQLSERAADWYHDPAIKYGGGPASIQSALAYASEAVARVEEFEQSAHELEGLAEDPRDDRGPDADDLHRRLARVLEALRNTNKQVAEGLNNIILAIDPEPRREP